MTNNIEFTQDGQDDFFEFDASYGTGNEHYSYEDHYLNREDANQHEDDQEEDAYEDLEDDDDDMNDDDTSDDDHPVYIKDMPPIDGARPGII